MGGVFSSTMLQAYQATSDCHCPSPKQLPRPNFPTKRVAAAMRAGHDPQSPNDSMIGLGNYFWSYDIVARTWRNEVALASGGSFSNMPCSRSKVPVATLGGSSGQQAVIFGGYSTCIHQSDILNNRTAGFSYLGDTFIYDVKSNTWKAVVSEEWSGHRAQSALVAVPSETAPIDNAAASLSSLNISDTPTAGPESGSGTNTTAGGRSGGRKHTQQGCRMFALGGLANGFDGIQTFPFTEVWELSLGSSLKHVRAMCWGCGKVEAGLKRCSGTCGGAVATCGSECLLARVWNEGGHRHWCKKMAGAGAGGG